MREKIIDAGRGIFNKKGLQKTTMRDIAKELSVSDGHVRYYFRTKEDLLKELFHQMDQEILGQSVRVKFDSGLLEGFKVALRGSFTVMTRYTFFFLESPQSLKQFPQLFQLYSQLYIQRKQLFLTVFESFKREGIFKANFTSGDLELLFEHFFIISDSWLRVYNLQNSTPVSYKDIDHYCNLSLKLFVPYLA